MKIKKKFFKFPEKKITPKNVSKTFPKNVSKKFTYLLIMATHPDSTSIPTLTIVLGLGYWDYK